MATKEEKPAADAAPAPRKSKKLLIIILAVVLLLVLGGGAAAFLLLKKSDHADEGEVATEKDKKKSAHEVPPTFVAMEPFTVNLVPETGDQYLQVTLSLEAEDAAVGEKVKAFTPKLRNQIMLLLSSKKPSELTSTEGKEQLANEILGEVNTILAASSDTKEGKDKKGEGGGKAVKEVLFTSFIIQ